jgi:hypothetical protein
MAVTEITATLRCVRCHRSDGAAAMTHDGRMAQIEARTAHDRLWDFVEDEDPHRPYCFECTVCGLSEAHEISRVFETVLN